MVLDDIRLMAAKKKEKLDNNPESSEASKRYYETVLKMLSNADYLVESPQSLVVELLYFVGYDFEVINDVYRDLMEELNTKIVLSEP